MKEIVPLPINISDLNIVKSNEDDDELVQFMRDLSERQSQLFFLVTSFLVGYQPPELQPLIDNDIAEAAAALAATLETSVRGVIYEHRPASLPAERLTGLAAEDSSGQVFYTTILPGT